MAINIQSGQTWAEIRAYLNEESINMESDSKKYAESLFEFSAGTTNMLSFGSAAIENKYYTFDGDGGVYIDQEGLVYNEDQNNLLISNGYFKKSANFAYLPLTSGEVKAKIIINQIFPDARYGTASGGFKTSYLEDNFTAEVSIKISIKSTDESDSIVIWEEKNVDLYESESNPESVFGANQVVIIDKLPVINSNPVMLIEEVTYHSIKTPSYSKCRLYSGNLSVSLYGGINNHLLETTSNNLGVWANE